jgi:enoyl-CoA hydratase
MPWTIERKHDHVAVVTMNTNKVNAQNPAFFADLHAAFDRLETEFDDCAVVLTGTGNVFSAGLDLDQHFAMYARRNLKEIDAFAAYRACRRCCAVCSRSSRDYPEQFRRTDRLRS